MGEIHDPEARSLSLMLKQKTLCDGATTGRCCQFYKRFVMRVESANADMLRTGEKGRFCLISPGFPIEMTEDEKRVQCNRYKPQYLTLLKRPFGFLKIIDDPFRYDASVESYDPLSLDELKEIQDSRKTPMPTANLHGGTGTAGMTAMAQTTLDAIEALKKEEQEMSAEDLSKALGHEPEDVVVIPKETEGDS